MSEPRKRPAKKAPAKKAPAKKAAKKPAAKKAPAKPLAVVTQLPGTSSIPEPPRPLGAEGRKTWDRLWALRKKWIQTDGDVEHVLLLCESIDERVGLRLTVLRAQEWRDRVALRQLDAQINDMLGRLGLTPADREKLTTGGAAEGGKLAQLRAAR